jgi:hypothetical protein
MSFQIAAALIIVLLFIIAGFLYDAVKVLNRVEDKLGKLDALQEQAKLLEQQNYRLESIAGAVGQKLREYVPPTVRFCDLCREEYPESNRWWTAYQWGLLPLKLCAYPKQKERPEDKWLHGEECLIAEMQGYLTTVQRQLLATGHKQKREYTERDEFGSEATKILQVSSCNHCGKEYSESDFWWTISRRGMQIEIREGFHCSSYQASDCYFCGEECAVAAARVFIGTQVGALPEEAWKTYVVASLKSARVVSQREATPGCRETQRGGGLRYVLPGEPDYQYSVPLGDSSKAHFVLCNAGFESTLKKDDFWAYVRTRPPGEWIKGWPVPATEEVENAFATFQSMGYLARKSGDQVIELVDSMHDGYLYKSAANSESWPRSIGYRLGALVRRIVPW